MTGKVQYVGRTNWCDIWYNGRMANFVIGQWYELPLEECANLIRSGKFVPDASTFQKLKSIYYTMKYKPIEGMLAGQDCYIIGSGSSLKEFVFEKIEGKGFILAINHSAKYCKSDAVIFMDEQFVETSKEFLQNYKGIIFAGWQSNYHRKANTSAKVYYFTARSHKVYEGKLGNNLYEGLYDTGSTGMCAINLALLMKARTIYLLGYDMNHETKGAKHFYNDDGIDMYGNEGVYKNGAKLDNMIKRIEQYYGQYTNIINCSKLSKINCFKKLYEMEMAG